MKRKFRTTGNSSNPAADEPDAGVRGGKKALEISVRIMPLKKQAFKRDIRCATAFATAYAEMRQQDHALSVAREYLQLLENYGKTE